MNFTQINIGGKSRPVRFSFAALYEYEKNTGRKAIEDFSRLQTEGVSVTLAADLIFAGLSLGAKTANAPVDFSVHDVADWAFQDQAVIVEIMEIFSESFPQTPADQEDGEEKKTKRRGKGGTT